MFVVNRAERKYITKTFRFPENVMLELEQVAKDNGVSLNEVAKQAIEYALDSIKKDRE